MGVWSAVCVIGAHGDQKRALSPLEWELQMAVSHYVAEELSSARAARALSHHTTFQPLEQTDISLTSARSPSAMRMQCKESLLL